MSHNPRTSLEARIIGVNAALWLCNGGVLRVYDEPQAPTVEAPQPGKVLATFQLAVPAFESAKAAGTDVVATARPVGSATVTADGKARAFRVFQKDGLTGVWQGTCGKGPTFDMNFNGTNQLVEGARLDLGAITYRVPQE